MSWLPKRHRLDAADAVAARTATARALEAISDQGLLEDPRTNPATRGVYDRLRDAQQRERLELDHRRALRRVRVADARAGEAARALEAMRAARESLSPARVAMLLNRGRVRFLAGALLGSILLSVGSALGLAAISTHAGGLAAAGWLAELCLTVMATTAILYRSHIDQATIPSRPGPAEPDHAAVPAPDAGGPWQGWRARVLLALVVAPLSVSVLANLAGWALGAPVSPINALCSLGAAAAAGFAFLVADVSAQALRTTARAISATDEAQLHAQASGDEAVFTAPAAPLTESPADASDLTTVLDAPLPDAHDTDGGLVAVDALLALEPGTQRRVVAVALDDPQLAETVLEVLHRRVIEDTPVPNDAAGLVTGDEAGDHPPTDGQDPGAAGLALADPPPAANRLDDSTTAPAPGENGGTDSPSGGELGAGDAHSSGQSNQGQRDDVAATGRAQRGRSSKTERARRARSLRYEQRKDHARALWDEGLSVAAIATRMGHQRGTITGYLLDRGITKDAMAHRTREDGAG